MEKKLALGIDTSNYKTSAAVVNEAGDIIFNHQKLLEVKSGERGLRQSEALFQHVQRLPGVLEELLSDRELVSQIGVVSVSGSPRPVPGSYMPVFTAGEGYARVLAASLGVPLKEFSHQEGHIEAIRFYSKFKDMNPLICFHFSGGTTEAVYVDDRYGRFEIVGGTKDISYGQLLDRVGVALGLEFPCGEALDKIALHAEGHMSVLTPIRVKEGYVNLSGIETQCQKLIGTCRMQTVVEDMFYKMSESIVDMTMQLSYKYDIGNFIYAGGVSSSRYLRNFVTEGISKDLNIVFGEPAKSTDNAIGTALLGGREIWR